MPKGKPGDKNPKPPSKPSSPPAVPGTSLTPSPNPSPNPPNPPPVPSEEKKPRTPETSDTSDSDISQSGEMGDKNESSHHTIFRLQPVVFDQTVSQKWPKWKEMFIWNMKASGKYKSNDEEQKIAILLTHMGDDAVDIYNTFEAGDKTKLVSVIAKFDEYCVPSANHAVETFKFNLIKHDAAQSFDSYLTALKTQAAHCNFVCKAELCTTSYADRMIVDHIVAHVNDGEVQQQLLKESGELKLETVAKICRAAELGKNYKREIQNPGTTETADVNYTKKSNKPRRNKPYDCKKCGTRHKYRQCPAYDKICPICSNKGHFEVGCLLRNSNRDKHKRRNRDRRCNEIEDGCTSSEDSEVFNCDSVEVEFDCNALKVDAAEWKECITVEKLPVYFKLDTASDVNIIPNKIFTSLATNKTIKSTNMRIKSYGGFTTKPLGIVNLKCTYKDKNENLDFLIVEYDSSPILSAHTCSRLGLLKRLYDIQEDSEKEKKSSLVSNQGGSSADNQSNKVIVKNKKFDQIHETVNNKLTEKPENDARKQKFISKNKDLFTGIGKLPVIVHIKLREDAVPVVRQARRLPEVLKSKLKKELDRLVKMDIIRKIDEPTEWVHDIVLVEKKDGSLRLCLNPIPLNKYIMREHFSIPTSEELTTNLGGKRYFTVLDYKEGFHQFVLSEESSKLCTMNTPFGRYCYKRMPYGCASFPEIFHRENSKIFGDIEGVQVLFDDIIVTGSTEAEHDRNLKTVMERARLNNVKFNKNKIQYKLNSVRYMGLVFTPEGVQPDPRKKKAINLIEKPTNVQQLQSFLGAVNFINKFIPAYSQTSAPLRELLQKKNPWVWTARQDESFDTLKKLVTNAPTLRIFDPKLDVVIQCDASKDGMGCCLLQNGQPVAFASRSLTPAQINYSQVEKEMLSICFSLNRYHYYIYGHKNLTIQTDHRPLLKIVKNDFHKNTARLQNMQLKLLKYDFTLEYIPGPKMYIADLLSRKHQKEDYPEDVDMSQIVHAISIEEYLPIPADEINALKQASQTDPVLTSLKKYINEGWKNVNRKVFSPELKTYFTLRNELFVKEDLVFYDARIVVPQSLRRRMIENVHKIAHLGINKTVARIRTLMYWPGMSSEIADFVGRCSVCQMFQNRNVKEPLISSGIPQYPFQRIGMDIGDYKGHIFLAVEDYYSRWLEILTLKNKSTGEIIQKLKVLFSTFGIPEVIRCDNNPFASAEMTNFANSMGCKIVTSSPHYSKSNGLSEKGVGIAKKLIKKSIQSGGDLQLALLEYRVTPLVGLDHSPSQLLMGRLLRSKAPASLELLLPRAPDEDVRFKMETLKMRSKTYYDSTASKEKTYSENQPIYIQEKESWKEGWIIKKLPEPRSYIVRDQNGQQYRRNSVHLRDRKLPYDSSPTLPQPAKDSPVPQVKRLSRKSAPPTQEKPTVRKSVPVEQETPVAKGRKSAAAESQSPPFLGFPHHDASPPKPPVKTSPTKNPVSDTPCSRSGRPLRKPNRLGLGKCQEE